VDAGGWLGGGAASGVPALHALMLTDAAMTKPTTAIPTRLTDMAEG
jgi:hypothetical protein